MRDGPLPFNFVFGFRSPYAWLANLSLDRILSDEADGDVRFIPYWNPAPNTIKALRASGGDFLYQEMSKARHFYILQDVKRLATQFDTTLHWPVDHPGQNWEEPHCLYLKACHAGKSRQARRLIFAARWSLGRNICDPAVLAALAADLGIGARMDIPLPERVEPLQWSHEKRVFGLPFFTIGRMKFWGLDRLPFALRAAGLPSGDIEKLWFANPAGKPIK